MLLVLIYVCIFLWFVLFVLAVLNIYFFVNNTVSTIRNNIHIYMIVVAIVVVPIMTSIWIMDTFL